VRCSGVVTYVTAELKKCVQTDSCDPYLQPLLLPILLLLLFLLLTQVDVIIDESYSFSTGVYVRLDDWLDNHKLRVYSIKAVNNRQVYTIGGMASQPLESGTVGLDWYERATARADEVRLGGMIDLLIFLLTQRISNTVLWTCSQSEAVGVDVGHEGANNYAKCYAYAQAAIASSARREVMCRCAAGAARLCASTQPCQCTQHHEQLEPQVAAEAQRRDTETAACSV
jgi:hypothetical protein